MKTIPLRTTVISGLLARQSDAKVTVVNADQLAEQAGLRIAMDGGGFTEAGPTHSTIYVAFNSFGVTGRWKGYQGIGRQDCIRHGYVNVPATCTYTISMHKR
mgnify:CR=1 FL=1